MKKILTAMFLAVALVAPVFADDTSLELIPKIGYLFSPEMTKDGHSSSNESTFSIGAELFFDMQNNFFLGAGLMWANYHKIQSASDDKYGFTDVYVAAKYKFLANDNQEDPIFLYPLIQIGAGVPSWSVTTTSPDFEVDGSFYWGIGCGGEYKNIVLEFIYGCNYATMKDRFSKEDFTYTAFKINVGYKFAL